MDRFWILPWSKDADSVGKMVSGGESYTHKRREQKFAAEYTANDASGAEMSAWQDGNGTCQLEK